MINDITQRDLGKRLTNEDTLNSGGIVKEIGNYYVYTYEASKYQVKNESVHKGWRTFHITEIRGMPTSPEHREPTNKIITLSIQHLFWLTIAIANEV